MPRTTFNVSVFAMMLTLVACQKEAGSFNSPTQSSVSATQKEISSNKQQRMVLFNSDRDGDYEVYAMNEDGSNLVQLTDNSVLDGRATWSSNGQLIAFVSGAAGSRDIYVMNANGHGLRNVSNTNADEDWVEWSPKGNKLLFSSNQDGNYEIYTMDLEGDNITRLTYRPATSDGWATYSPDGTKIAFHSNVGATTGST